MCGRLDAMNQLRHDVVLIAILALACSAFAQTQPAATRPIERTSPRAAFRGMYQAQMAGSPAMMREVLYAADPAGQALLDARIAQYEVMLRLTDVGTAEWGMTAYTMFALPPRTPLMSQAEFDAMIERVPETIDGNTGTLKFDDRTIRFVKVGEHWRLPIEEDVRGITNPPLMNAKTRAMREIISMIEADKFRSPDQAVNAYTDLLTKYSRAAHESMGAAATRPAGE